MAKSIPGFHRRIEELKNILESVYKKLENAKNALKDYQASQPVLGMEHKAMLKILQDSLQNAVKLAFPKQHMSHAYLQTHRKTFGEVS